MFQKFWKLNIYIIVDYTDFEGMIVCMLYFDSNLKFEIFYWIKTLIYGQFNLITISPQHIFNIFKKWTIILTWFYGAIITYGFMMVGEDYCMYVNQYKDKFPHLIFL